MKQGIFVVIMFATFVAAQKGPPANVKQKIDADVASCQASESPTQADIDMFHQNIAPTSDAAKCFVGCMFERVGLIVNGAFSRSNADAHANTYMAGNQTLLAIILKNNQLCEAAVGGETDKCVTGPKLMQCLEKNLPGRPKRT